MIISPEDETTRQIYSMIEFLSLNSRALLPTFLTNSEDGSHFVQMWSCFAQNATPFPCSYSAVTLPSWGYVVHKTPTSPLAPQNTPFPGLNLKVSKLNYRLGNLATRQNDPN